MSQPRATMNAWRLKKGENELQRRSVPIPKPGPDHVLVRLLAMGVCHSDCIIRDNTQWPPTWHDEFTMGHEGAGEIVEFGPGVARGGLAVGDRVAIHLNPGCKRCASCASGLERICQEPDNGGYGIGRDGFFAEYVAARVDALVRVPDGVRIEDAAVAPDALLTAYHAVRHTAAVRPGQTVALLGMGGLGLNGLQVARHLGAGRILVSDRRQEALDLAVALGGVAPEDAIRAGDGTPDAPAFHETVARRGLRIDTVLDFVGHEQTVRDAQLAVRPGGTIVQVGVLHAQGPYATVLMVARLLTIKGVYAGTVDGLRECLDLVARGVIRPQLSTAAVGELPRVLRDLDEGKYQGRKVLLPDWGDV